MIHNERGQQPLDYLVVLDFEATCNDNNPPAPQEIIEFPSVLVSMRSLEPVDEFSSFVKPQHNPQLTEFCMKLTGITQEHIDKAPGFPQVLKMHLDWLRSHNLPVKNGEKGFKYILATCGDWDLGNMFPRQCKQCSPPLDNIPFPYRQWMNIKHAFAQWKGVSKSTGMPGMLKELGLELVGHHHRGIDDCRNLAKVVIALADKGRLLEPTTKLSLSRYGPLILVLNRDGVRAELQLEKRSLKKLLGKASGLFKCQVRQVFLCNRQEITCDEQLFDLEQNTKLIVSDKK